MSARPAAILIAGPTASGKSALAIRLARDLDGIVINADSMQVYANLRIITARPTPDEEAQAPHVLFGHVDGAVNYSVGRWLEDAACALAEARRTQRTPIFVGGTGMYFKALTQGLSDIPKVPEEIRARIRADAEGLPPQTLHELLALIDPGIAARLRPTDPQRILRALEVHAATGRSLLDFQGARTSPLLDIARCRAVFLAPDRAELARRIDARFDAMMDAGALEEVRRMAGQKLDPALPVMRAHGVPGLIAYMGGACSLDDAIRKGKTDTRHYSKRQFTFVRHQLREFLWSDPGEAYETVCALAERPPTDG